MIQNEVLEIWFGDTESLIPPEAHRKRWFAKNRDFDNFLTERFKVLIERGYNEAAREFDESPLGGLAQIILFDQFSRNIFRGSPQAFANDSQNLQFAQSYIEQKKDSQLSPHQAAFCYMPLMHSENLQHQEKCIALFEALIEGASEELKGHLSGFLKAAHYHKEPIERFGRFPYRNEVLGRESTPDEIEFLKSQDSWP